MVNTLPILGAQPTTAEQASTTASKDKLNPRTIPEDAYPGLNWKWRELWNTHGSQVTRPDEVTIAEFRRDPAKYTFSYATQSGPDVPKVDLMGIPVTNPPGSILMHVYTPAGPGPFPVHLNFHGGGGVESDLDTERAWCRYMCNAVGIIIFDVAYRKAPQCPFPTAIHDCWAAVQWVCRDGAQANADPQRMSFGGLGAGGHIAAVLAHFARDEGVPVKLQLLVVPAVDLRHCHRRIQRLDKKNCPYPSARALQDAPWGPLSREQWYLKQWLGDDDAAQDQALASWLMTPLLAPSFANLAPAHVVTAEFDMGRDAGRPTRASCGRPGTG
ncbi:CAZyme family CE10 [Apiospora marii]|uniref:CAZyme family CE10 n=1 Tax=Apiospora marii TaxID=335849 RepID=UPI003130CB76